jgi:hypothetical protein
LESLFIWWIEARRADVGNLDTMHRAEKLLTQERAIAPETERLPVVTVYWLRIADRCGEAMLAAEEAIRRFSNGAGAYAVLGHCKTETGHAEEEIPLQAQAIRLNLAIHICSIATGAWASPR